MRSVLKGNGITTTWRSAILLQTTRNRSPAYHGVRKSTGNKYVEYEGGVRELYYLKSYPYELANRYGAAAALTTLASRLRALERCTGASCRAAENWQ